jgi:hypothetical protein
VNRDLWLVGIGLRQGYRRAEYQYRDKGYQFFHGAVLCVLDSGCQ